MKFHIKYNKADMSLKQNDPLVYSQTVSETVLVLSGGQ